MKFLRRDCTRYSKFGKGRGKKAKWRAPKGRDNKMREKKKGYSAVVSIGYGKDKKITPVVINNIRELENANKEQFLVIGNVGKKKQIEMVKKAKELGLELKNINIEAYLKKISKENKK